MDMDLNNRLTEDETLEQAYDIFFSNWLPTISIQLMFCCSIFSLKSAAARSYSIRRKTGRNMLISDLNPDFLPKW